MTLKRLSVQWGFGVAIWICLSGWSAGGCSDSSDNHSSDSDSDSDSDTDSDTDTDSDSDSDSDTDSDTDTDSDSDSDECANLPSLPRPSTFIKHVSPSEDFVFDIDGNIVQMYDQWNAVATKSTYSGESTIVASVNEISAQGTRMLPTGEIVVTNARKNELIRIYPNGSYESFANGIESPNGLAVDMDGFIYASSPAGKIFRVDPTANSYEVVLEYSGASFDGISFSPDYRTLYFDEEIGNVHKAKVNGDGSLSDDELILNIMDELQAEVGELWMDMLDGMTVDACGNLYVVVMNGIIVRVTPDGEADVATRLSRNDRGIDVMTERIPAANFGSGIGGWKADHLYVMSFLGGIYEVDMGITGKPEPHL
jgi:sugar lactone lactonase YvrE